ncbi:MAG: VOC family protein [Solirubrobacteraceae bacterium]|nr:VOC family protein [Patulibacter sp.]
MPAITLNLSWIIVYVPEIDRALSAYEAAFGLTRAFITPDETYGELDTGSTTLAFAHDDLGPTNFPGGPQRPALTDKPANLELAFTTDDVAAGVAQAVAAGFTVLSDPTEKPHGQTVAYVRDPWGTLIEIATPIG